jgi:AraC-like DNA-binding protein
MPGLDIRDRDGKHLTGILRAEIRCCEEWCTGFAIARRSKAHFSRKFKQAVGESPHAYVVRRRLERACHLMITSVASLSKIALSAGFSDQAHLCSLFRQAFGQSPAGWRREREIPSEENRRGREYPMSDQYGKVLSLGPFGLSIGNRLLTNGAKVVPLGARAMDISSPASGDVKPRLVSVNSAADISQTSTGGLLVRRFCRVY